MLSDGKIWSRNNISASFTSLVIHIIFISSWILVCIKNTSSTKFLYWFYAFRAFDIELLYIAETFNIDIHEVAVNWQEIEGESCCNGSNIWRKPPACWNLPAFVFAGSKLIPVFSWLQMAIDILRIRIFYLLALWKMDKSSTGNFQDPRAKQQLSDW